MVYMTRRVCNALLPVNLTPSLSHLTIIIGCECASTSASSHHTLTQSTMTCNLQPNFIFFDQREHYRYIPSALMLVIFLSLSLRE